MKPIALLVVLGTAITIFPMASLAAGPVPGDAKPYGLQYQNLGDRDALARLQKSNPRHYEIVRRVLAAGNEFCEATKPAPMKMRFDLPEMGCSQIWFASNPPKRFLNFRIDDVIYTAIITVPATHATLNPIH